MALARMTIAQLREREVNKLARFKSENPSEEDYAEAKRMMNRFYRLCGLEERLLYLENDERTYNSWYTKECDAKAERWRNRLNADFKRIYGLELVYCGYAPSIGVVDREGRGGFHEKINRWFYE